MAQPTVTSDVFASPALPLLLDLERLGCHVEVTSNTIIVEPASRLSAEQQATVRALAPDLAALVRCCDEGVQTRRAAFAGQLAAAHGRLPAFVLEPAPPYIKGWCFACGDALPAMQYARCWRCSLAWRLAAGVRLSGEAAAALDDARVMA